MPAPPAAAVAAILNGTTRVTRRVEIYEADGKTPWQPRKALNSDDQTVVMEAYKASLIEGNVSVDSARDERRNVDLTLDNKGGILTHSPDDFWYDKIMKVFRGVKFNRKSVKPKIACLGGSGDHTILSRYLIELGFPNDAIASTDAARMNADFLLDYDIIAVLGESATLTDMPAVMAVVRQLYGMGKDVISFGHTLGTEVPLVATVGVAFSGNNSTRAFVWTQSAFGHPFANFKSHTARLANGKGIGASIGALAANTSVAANVSVLTNGSPTTNSPGILYQSNATSDGRWVHYHTFVSEAPHTNKVEYLNTRRTRNMIAVSAIEWLFDFNENEDLRWETQIGEFMIDSISSQRHPKQIKVVGRDYTKKLMSSQFDNTTSFAKGTKVNTVIAQIAANAGILKTKLNAPSSLALTGTLTFSNKTTRWDAIKEIAKIGPIEVFFDAFGYLVTRSFFDPLTSTPTFVLKHGGSDGNIIDYNETSDETEMYNRVVAYGISSDSESTVAPFIGIAENRNAASKTSIQNLGYSKTFVVESTSYTSNAQCLAAAKAWLNIKGLEAFSFSYNSVVFAWLEAGEVVTRQFDDVLNGEPENFLHDSFTIPLNLESMSGTAKRLTIVG